MTLNSASQPEAPAPKMYNPRALWSRYSVPRDLIYSAIKTGSLKAYNVGSPKRSRLLVRPEDFEAWLETLAIGAK